MAADAENGNARDGGLPLEKFRNCSEVPPLGLCKLQTGPADPAHVRRWLDFIIEVATSAAAPDHPTAERSPGEQTIKDINETGVTWRRISQQNVFPFYVESITVAENVTPAQGETLPVTRQFPGTFILSASVFDPAHADFFEKNREAWAQWVTKNIDQPSYVGGLSVNLLEIPAEALHSGTVDVRPLTLHALAPDGRAVDRGDADAQSAIANAFWQTFWATGATRTERGSVFPVAFLPIDRSSKHEFAEPFHERYVTLRRRFFGRSAIVCYPLEALTKAKALLFCTESLRFMVAETFSAADAEISAADVLLAVDELNRTGFMDAYIGDNAQQFAGWVQRERNGQPGEPWPYDDSTRRGKIKAAGHGLDDPLKAVRADADAPHCAIIHRVVPYAGCAFLYQIMTQTDDLIRRGKIQDFDGELVGGTNSTFFLNFPEEYSALHSAMNEPVALLVENGQTRQIRSLRRAAFVLTESGDAFITTRAGNNLTSEVLLFEGESSATNYFEKSDKSFRENRFGPLFFGAAVVGNSIVETFEEIATEVPPAGWLTGDSEAFGGRIDPAHVARVQVRRPGSLSEEPIRHAFAVGPLLVDEGQIVPLGESREEFRTLSASTIPAFDESSRLSRTELPEALLDCEQRGVPPTRFPYDWNITRAPRSAIGVRHDGTVLIAVVDGRADVTHSVGATLAELAEIMKGLGCHQAMNMDGGGSSVMFVNHEQAKAAKLRDNLHDGVVNLPSDMGGTERLLPVPLVVARRKP